MVVRLFDNFIYKLFCKLYKYLVKHNLITPNFTYDFDFWGDII